MAGSSGLITLVFTDMVGSTELSESIGDRAADELRRVHFAILRETVANTGGTTVKTIGDAMMAAYTSASDAIEGAVAMQKAVARANREHAGPQVSMRIGLSAGDATYEDGDWFGRPVVEASRLCAAAEGAQILAAEIVRNLAGNRSQHALEPRGECILKGITEPVTVCEVAWDDPTSAAADRVGEAPPLPDALARATGDGFGFVAREEELERLVLAWKDVVAGSRRTVLVTGEPGVGKSRLTSELAFRAYDEGGIVLWGGCDEELGIPYQPLAEALGHYVHSVSADALRAALGPLGPELTRLVPELASLLPGLEVADGTDPDAERRRLAEALNDFLATASQERPVLLVLDDLHWVGKPTLVLLRQLLRSVRPMRLLVIGTYRDTDLDRRHPLSEMLADLRHSGDVERISLSGLGAGGVEALMESAAGHDLDESGRYLAIAVHHETEGNPFFVREVLFHLVESGALVNRDGRWVSDVRPDQMAIPEGVREVIGRRLSRLPDATNELLAEASVLGREFDVGLLTALHEGGREAVLDHLEPAEVASIVRPAAGRSGAYLFAHALVRSTLYDELSTSRRLRLHRDAGRALEARGDVDRHLSELARHFGEAAALGEVKRAADYGRRAGDRAAADLAFEEAAAHYGRALGALDVAEQDDPTLRCDLLIALGAVEVHASDPKHRATLLSAATLARKLSDDERLTDAVLALGYRIGGGTVKTDEEHVGLLEECLERLSSDDSPRRARLLSHLAVALVWQREEERRRTLSDEALAMARRIGDRTTLAEVLSGRFAVYDSVNPDSLEFWIDTVTEVLTLAAGTAPPLECDALLQRAPGYLVTGDRAASEADLAAARELAQRLREPRLLLRSKVLDNMVVLLSGRLEDAESGIFDFLRFSEAHGLEDSAANAAGGQFFRLRYEQGRLGELIGLLSARVEEFPNIPTWRIGLASAYAQTDALDRAREHVEFLAADDFAVVPRDGLWIVTVTGVARVAAEMKELDIARRAYELGGSYRGRLSFTGSGMEQPFDLSLGVAAWALGDLDEAEVRFRSAIDVSERAGAPTFVAASRFEWAQLLAERDSPGDRQRADHLAGLALATAEELGLSRIREKATSFLTR